MHISNENPSQQRLFSICPTYQALSNDTVGSHLNCIDASYFLSTATAALVMQIFFLLLSTVTASRGHKSALQILSYLNGRAAF